MSIMSSSEFNQNSSYKNQEVCTLIIDTKTLKLVQTTKQDQLDVFLNLTVLTCSILETLEAMLTYYGQIIKMTDSIVLRTFKLVP